MSENSSDLGAFLAGFVIGGLVGAATAIILAPQSGQETRAQIAAKSEDLIHAGEVQVQHYREAANTATLQYMDRAGEMVTQTQEQARIVLDRGRETAENGNATAEQPTDTTDDGEQPA
ncbi:MAG: YtxH domain-containing protein [Chloroflexi bacterium]|nr:YtxH domain-containing protein [Chloroflexota bacterium]